MKIRPPDSRRTLVRMLMKEYQVTIQVLHQQGMSARAISRELKLAGQTVLKVIHGRSDQQYGPRSLRPTKLEPFHGYIAQRLAEAAPKRLAASVIMREIQSQGYLGGGSQLRAYIASMRPAIPQEPILRVETEPGQQMQIDFVVFRRGDNPLRAFTATLGYSRMSFVHFTNNERAETWASCIESAFSAFGGVPQSILCDNSKSIVIERHAYGPAKHRLHSLIWDIAKHYGVRIYLCQPYRAQTKGKRERFHRYLRESFFMPIQNRLGQIPIDIPTANRAVHTWLRDVANTRLHATLKERPCDRYIIEREALSDLPLPYGGKSLREGQNNSTMIQHMPTPMESLQHPLNTYATFSEEIAP